MLKKIIEWFRTMWSDDAPEFIGDAYRNEYEREYLRSKYGISQPFAEEE